MELSPWSSMQGTPNPSFTNSPAASLRGTPQLRPNPAEEGRLTPRSLQIALDASRDRSVTPSSPGDAADPEVSNSWD